MREDSKDVAPELLNDIRERFERKIKGSETVKEVYAKIQTGRATYEQAELYAELLGKFLSESFTEVLTPEALPDGKLYYNIAQRVVYPMLESEHKLVVDAAFLVQESLNKSVGIGLKAQTVPFNTGRAESIINSLVAPDEFGNAVWMLEEPIIRFSMTIADDVLQENIRFQNGLGLRPKIIRTATSRCCKRCNELAGVYEYPETGNSYVFWRHNSCRCIVDYDPGDRSSRRQNVHSKKWTTAEERAKIEARKTVGVKSLPQQLAEHPSKLAAYTPASLIGALKNAGFDVKPLKQGHLKNIPFEDGGGFKVNFEDGGILQYHPEKHSHHGGSYYKISTGKGGKHWYELDGTEKEK